MKIVIAFCIVLLALSCSKTKSPTGPFTTAVSRDSLSLDTIDFRTYQNIVYRFPSHYAILTSLDFKNAVVGTAVTIVSPISSVRSFALNTDAVASFASAPTAIQPAHSTLSIKFTYLGLIDGKTHYSIEQFSY